MNCNVILLFKYKKIGDLLQDNISLLKLFITQVFFNNNRVIIVVTINRTVLSYKLGEVWLQVTVVG